MVYGTKICRCRLERRPFKQKSVGRSVESLPIINLGFKYNHQDTMNPSALHTICHEHDQQHFFIPYLSEAALLSSFLCVDIRAMVSINMSFFDCFSFSIASLRLASSCLSKSLRRLSRSRSSTTDISERSSCPPVAVRSTSFCLHDTKVGSCSKILGAFCVILPPRLFVEDAKNGFSSYGGIS